MESLFWVYPYRKARLKKTTSCEGSQNLHDDSIIKFVHSLRKILLYVESKNVLKFENHALKLTSIFRRSLEKNVKKLPPKCHTKIFHK